MYPTTATAISKPPDSRIRPAKLVLEVPETELDWVKEKLPQMMAKVDAGILKAPLVAEAGCGSELGRCALILLGTILSAIHGDASTDPT